MILFFGPPGSGKSVQGQLLVARNGWNWISTGDLFRNSQDTEVLKRMATGELIDDELTNKVLGEELENLRSSGQIVLDGYPRNLDQVKWLEENLPAYDQKIEAVVLFEVSRDELIRRLSGRGRLEDTPEVIGRRLDIYQERTKPLIEYYKQHNTPVQTVDGMATIGVVHDRIQEAVDACLPK